VSQVDLAGHVSVVTGACGRLGPVWIGALLDAGATVLAIDLDDRDPSEAWRAVDASADPARLLFVAADISDRGSLVSARAACLERWGRIDSLVNNAGVDTPPSVGAGRRLTEIPLGEFTRVLDVNVTGAFAASQVFVEPMLAVGAGVIVNIGSLYASVSPDHRFYEHLPMDPPFVKPPAYGASKAALVNLTKFLATHWAGQGVRVNSLSPGGVAGGQDPQFVEKYTARVPMGRMAEPADLVGPLLFLISDASRYVTGIDLRVDGGFTAW
jgi:NAD(P)-dependent dehydrogenase (short-subunit alcohol dehydrogenase family)